MSMIDDKWFRVQQRKAGVTADVIADRLGKDRSLVSRIYVGRQQMKLDEAKIFAEVLGAPLDEVIRRAGIMGNDAPQAVMPGFSEGDAVPFVGPQAEKSRAMSVAEIFGARPGVDVWRVNTLALSLHGYMPGDLMLVDTHGADAVRPGDVVIAQVYENARNRATTVLRRFEPPVLVAASRDLADDRILVVDGVNVAIRGKVTACWRQI